MREDLAAQADQRGGERVDRDLEREDDGPCGSGETSGRAAGRAVEGGRAFGHEAAAHELADQRRGWRCGSARCASTSSDRDCGPLAVQLADDGAEVRAANGLAAVPELVATEQHWGL